MLNKGRIFFLVLILVTIFAGLLSRQIAAVPMFAGDILWALMVYFMVKFLFIHKPIAFIVIGSLLFCYGIEFSQLYKAMWIDSLRHTLFGRLVLGDTFLWSDLLCYTVGIGIGVGVDLWVSRFARVN
jgi:hypothetical protein